MHRLRTLSTRATQIPCQTGYGAELANVILARVANRRDILVLFFFVKLRLIIRKPSARCGDYPTDNMQGCDRDLSTWLASISLSIFPFPRV